MKRLAFILALLFAVSVRAEMASAIIEHLLIEAWKPQTVRIEWDFNGDAPALLAAHDDWQIAEPKPTRLAGSMILKLTRAGADSDVNHITVSGNARILGMSLTSSRSIRPGVVLDSANIAETECDWTRLSSEPLTRESLNSRLIAVRTLVPGRPITMADVKQLPTIRRDQSVELCLTDGTVTVRLRGRALRDGAIGERIPVSVTLDRKRRFDGIVAANGTVTLAR